MLCSSVLRRRFPLKPMALNATDNSFRTFSISPVLLAKKEKKAPKKAKQSLPLIDGTEDDDEDDSEDGMVYPVLHKPKIRINEPFDVKLVVELLRERKLEDIIVIDISKKVNWYQYFIVATGRSGSHINNMASLLQSEAKKRISTEEFKIHQKGNNFWVIFTATDEIIVNLFTEEEREEYDLERVWVLRRDERNPLAANFDDVAETEWIYDDEDGQFDNWDPMDQEAGEDTWLNFLEKDYAESKGKGKNSAKKLAKKLAKE
jgi:ribosome silencing factor RsfS/YbeB/iojap